MTALGWCLKMAGYVHATLIFALIIPLLYALADLSDPAGAGILYLKCLLVCVPVIVTERAVKRAKHLASYLLTGALLVTGVWSVPALTGSTGAYALCYNIGMTVEIFIVAVKRLRGRLKESAKRKESDPFAAKEEEFLDTPSLLFVWYFAAVYVAGTGLDAKPLCDMAFYSAIAYFFTSLFYTYFTKTASYLEMNRRTKGIPQRRLYGVGFSMLLVFSLLVLMAILPSVFMAGHRKYTDIRHWFDDMGPAAYRYQSGEGFDFPGMDFDIPGMMEQMTDGKAPPEPSIVVEVLLRVIAVVCIFVLVCGIFMAVRQVFRDFRDSRDENGDIIEALGDRAETGKEVRLAKRRRGTESEAEKIRRSYRKMIRMHRKERPAPYESPAEIEELAGLKDDERMHQLHREYEKVRYGRSGKVPDP